MNNDQLACLFRSEMDRRISRDRRVSRHGFTVWRALDEPVVTLRNPAADEVVRVWLSNEGDVWDIKAWFSPDAVPDTIIDLHDFIVMLNAVTFHGICVLPKIIDAAHEGEAA